MGALFLQTTPCIVYSTPVTRRAILRQSGLQAAAVWTALAQDHSHMNGAPPAAGGLKFFTPEQAREIEAVAAQILPTDDTPGAREAGVIRFIDLNLATYDKDKQAAYTAGLKLLAEKAGGRFSELDSARQIAVLREIERTPFFGMIRLHTLMGFLSHPQYGGNREQTAWKLVGFEDAFVFQPPFGYYDGPEGLKEP